MSDSKLVKTSDAAARMRDLLNKKIGVEVAKTITKTEDLLQVKDWIVMPSYFHKAVGGQGFPVGHVTQIVGESDTGKTTLAMEGMISTQKQGGVCYLIDGEHKFSFERFRIMGGIPEDIVTIPVENLEDAWTMVRSIAELEKLEKLENPDKISAFMLWDSVPSLMPKKVNADDPEDAIVAVQAKVNNKEIRKIRGLMASSNIAYAFINHTYWSMPSFGPSKEVIKGGTELYYLSTLILKTKLKATQKRQFNSIDDSFGILSILEVKKGHLGARVAFPFYVVAQGILDDKDQFEAYKAALKGKDPNKVRLMTMEELLTK